VSFLGVEDGQMVRMPVGKKEIFITFRVSEEEEEEEHVQV